MTTNSSPTPITPPALVGMLSAALALIASPAAAQERSPYYIGLSQAFSHDTNVFRTSTNPVSETISSTGLLAGFDQPIGRQRLYADASAQINRFNKLDALDNKSYGLNAGLDWETIEALSGQLRYSVRESLADFGTLGGATTPSDQQTQQFQANARYGLSSRLSLDAGYEHRRLEYSNDVYRARDYKQDAVNAGVLWGTQGLLTFGLAYRHTNGSTPHFQVAAPQDDQLRRRDIDLTAHWTPTGFSTLRARLSSTRETHSQSSTADLSAVTGSLTWDYRPTAKLAFSTSIVRDTGTETTFLATPGSGTTALPVDSARLTTRGQLDANYAVTSKIALHADTTQVRGTLSGGAGTEKLSSYGLGATYTPTRNTSLACHVMRESRDVQGSTAYSATTTSCSAQITLR